MILTYEQRKELARLKDAMTRVERQLREDRCCVGRHRDDAYHEKRVIKAKLARFWAEAYAR